MVETIIIAKLLDNNDDLNDLFINKYHQQKMKINLHLEF